MRSLLTAFHCPGTQNVMTTWQSMFQRGFASRAGSYMTPIYLRNNRKKQINLIIVNYFRLWKIRKAVSWEGYRINLDYAAKSWSLICLEYLWEQELTEGVHYLTNRSHHTNPIHFYGRPGDMFADARDLGKMGNPSCRANECTQHEDVIQPKEKLFFHMLHSIERFSSYLLRLW